LQGRYQPTAADLTVQRRMMSYWVRTARSGNPNGGGNPEWPVVTRDNDAYLEIGSSTATARGPQDALRFLGHGHPAVAASLKASALTG